jgi:DNA-binding transcriptional LysR family regulator
MFHVFRLEQPTVRLDWQPVGYPVRGRSLLEGADVGVLVHPPAQPGVRTLTLDAGPMVVVVAVDHRLADHDELTVADVLEEPFAGGTSQHPEWAAFRTLDPQRGGPPRRTDDDVADAWQELEVVAAERATATVPDWVAGGLAQTGVVAIPLVDGPAVTTRLLWRADEENRFVRGMVELATAWTRGGR